MDVETREILDAERSVAGRLRDMGAAHETEGSQAGLIAAGILLAMGGLLDAVCDEIEARG